MFQRLTKRASSTAQSTTEARLCCYRELSKALFSHIVELRKVFLAGEEDPRETLSAFAGILSEKDPKALREGVDEARRQLRGMVWTARQVREAEKKQVAEIGGLVAETALQLRGSDERLAGRADKQLEQLDNVLTGQSDTSPRVALAVTVRHLRQAFDDFSTDRQEQTQRMNDLVTTLQAELEDAREQGARDPLTNLFNRRSLDEELATNLARCNLGLRSFGLILLDIDHFKRVNDEYGHPAGDAAIKHVSNLLIKTCLRKDDFVARYGGEEFAIILQEVSAEALVRAGDRVRAQVESSSLTFGPHRISFTISAGVGLAHLGDCAETILERVDSALYEAKESGRNRVVEAR